MSRYKVQLLDSEPPEISENIFGRCWITFKDPYIWGAGVVPGLIPGPGIMWVEFVVGSRPCSKGFSPGYPVFLPPQKPTFLNSNLIGNLRATGLSVEHCCVSPSLNKVDLFIWYTI